MTSYRVAVAIGLGVAIWMTTPARAQSGRDLAAAETLFNEAIPLIQRGDYEAAARKLEASHEYDPAFATVMNLALCYKKLGKLASAWARYREAADMAADMAAQSGDTRPQKKALRRARALERKLSRLVIKVSEETQSIPGLTVLRGDRNVVPGLFNTAIYVDPGDHDIKATAPGHEEFSIQVTTTRSKPVTVEILRLQVIPESPRPSDKPEMVDSSTPGRDTRRIVGWAGIGAGAALTIGGLGFGWSAISTWNDAIDSECDAATLECSAEGKSQVGKARFRSNVSNVMVGAGLLLAAAGTWRILTAHDTGQATQVVPSVGSDGESVSLTVMGRF